MDLIERLSERETDSVKIQLHYRFDRFDLDTAYISNTATLHRIDSLIRQGQAQQIDSLIITAYASPEGNPNYNKRLSKRRATTFKRFLINRYPDLIKSTTIITEAKGENWEGFRRMAANDPELPLKEEVLSIISNPQIDEVKKQSLIARLDRGRLYKYYILPNYYRYLRSGASLFIVYNHDRPTAIGHQLKEIQLDAYSTIDSIPSPIVPSQLLDQQETVYPIALKSNLLFDVLGAYNGSIEVPIGRQFSIVTEFMYSYWQRNNLFALQTRQITLEGRYWLPVSSNRKIAQKEWNKPLRGWSVGAYATYCSRFDIQLLDGYQGDGYWSFGATAGYSTPIARNLMLEFSVAAGYFFTPEVRHYHQPEQGYLLWQETRYNYNELIVPTRLALNLVYLISYKKRKKNTNGY